MELFLVIIFTALVVAVVIENGSCSFDHPVLEYAATRQRRASSSSSSSSRRISSLIHKRAAATTGLAGFERGRNHFDPEKDEFFGDFRFKKGQYEFGQQENLDFADIRNNISGEPGIDYAAYLKVPRTRFSCIGRTQGYYADEETGCQVFHVCGGVGEGVDNDQISSFLCPVGSLFSQYLLTCDWWSKVVCGSSSSNTVGENEKVVDWNKMNFVRATDLIMMKRAGQQPEKATFRRRQQENDMEINGKQISLPKKLEHSHFAGVAFANGDERASSLNTARTTINQLNGQSIRQGSLTNTTAIRVDERLVESNQSSTGEKKSKITSTPSLNEINNDAKVTGGAADIDGEESVGLINAHSKRMNTVKLVMTTSTNLQILGSSFTEKTNIHQPQHMTRKLDETTKNTAVANEIKYLSESDTLKAENVVFNSTETSGSGGSNDVVSAAVINNQSPRDNATAVEYLHKDVSTHIASAAKNKNGFVVTHGDGGSSVDSRHQTAPMAVVNINRYKTQNVHNISGFKINRPVVIAVTVAPANAEKFHSNLDSNTIYQQRQPAMQLQLARLPQTHRQSKGVQREKIKSNLENYSIEQNHGRTNLTDLNWQGNIGQTGIQEHSINNAVKRTQHLEQQESKQYQLTSSLRRTPYGRRRHPHDMKFTVNYRTHYYPEIYQRSASAAAHHVDISNNNKYKTNHNEETNYAVPYDESQSSITCYQHYDDAVSEVEQKQASDDLKFGSRIHIAAAAAAVVDNDDYHYKQYSTIVNNPEISRNAYKINSELQKESRGLAIVGHVQTATAAAAPIKDNLPRPFTAAKNNVNYLHAMDSYMLENDANSFSVSDDFDDSFEHAAVTAAATAADDERTIIVNSSSISAGADDKKMPIDDSYKGEYIERASAKKEEEEQSNKRKVIVQTEFIASLDFELSNDEEKKRYYENFPQQGSPWEKQGRAQRLDSIGFDRFFFNNKTVPSAGNT